MLTLATLKARPSSRQLLSRVLETPELPQRIRALPALALGKLIDEVGLADAGELVALASTEQLAEIFDHDLWQSPESGRDERFDAERFLVWLEVMAEAGERVVAEHLAELPTDLVTLALHRHLLVVPLAELEHELRNDDDAAFAAEKALASCLSEELDEYQLIWRGGEGWDALWSALLALDRDHHCRLVELLERCASLSHEQLDDNGGLYEVLTSEEMLEDDLAGEREARRAEAGFVAPSAARAFLRLACGPATRETPFSEHDPLTMAYFRRLGSNHEKPAVSRERHAGRLLPGALSAHGQPSNACAEPLLIQALRRLNDEAPLGFAKRANELSYLANVLVAGASIDGRRLRPVEAVELAIETVSAGLALACACAPGPVDRAATARALHQYPCDGLFRLAFERAGAPVARGPRRKPDGLEGVRRLLKALEL
jgi:hypothetical protein